MLYERAFFKLSVYTSAACVSTASRIFSATDSALSTDVAPTGIEAGWRPSARLLEKLVAVTPGIDQPEGNVVGSKLLAAYERNGVERVLCGGVGTDGIRPVSLWWDLRSAGTDIDNHAPALGSHDWNDLLHRRDDADDV